LPRKRRSLLGAPAAPSATAAAAPDVPAADEPAPAPARERTTPVTEAIPRRGEPKLAVTPRPTETPAGSFPTPPTRDRASDAWFLASGQSPPERTATDQDPPAAVPAQRNPWLWAAPVAGVAAVGLLFALVLAVALAMFS
jgi:hypothetical protein